MYENPFIIFQVYKIELNDVPYFSWVAGGPGGPVVEVKPNDKWKTPLNFDTHEKYFGPGPKTEHIDELKKAIQAKC